MEASKEIDQLFRNNAQWAKRRLAEDPEFFSCLSAQQKPEFLWIGCSDSRVPANDIVGLDPGELFVHRNVGNLVVFSDLNCLSVLQFAVEVLEVKHIIVCGHFCCGGVQAAWERRRLGLVDNWLRYIQEIRDYYGTTLDKLAEKDEQLAINALCKLNVAVQISHLAQTEIVQTAWENGAKLSLHGWVYDLADGLLQDTGAGGQSVQEVHQRRQQVIASF
ncbi:MAG: carbonate dehydratase [Verrucomicrobiales bacterium]